LRGRSIPQRIRVSWTKVYLGGERPWMHCPHCERRVARLHRGLGGYFCRECIGMPAYASQRLSAQGRAHYRACKLRLRLDGEAQLSKPFPQRPRGMHRRTYQRLRREGMSLETSLSKCLRNRFPDYASLCAYFEALFRDGVTSPGPQATSITAVFRSAEDVSDAQPYRRNRLSNCLLFTSVWIATE
jgi:hypothetical protein